MSDFGANIFDDRHPAPEKVRRRKAERAPSAAPTTPTEVEPARVQEVPLQQPDLDRDEAKDLGFEMPAVPEAAQNPPPPREDRHAGSVDQQVRPPAQRHPEPRHGRDRREPEGRGGWRDERSRDEARSTRPRQDDGPRRPPQGCPTDSQPPLHTADRRPRPAASIAILVDLVALQVEARGHGGELALHRLRGGLVGDRACTKAICYAPRGSTPPNGFELRPNEDNVGGIGLAAAALELASSGATLVLAPPSPAIRQLAAALRKAGNRIELAGFAPPPDDGHPGRRLGRDCLFVP